LLSVESIHGVYDNTLLNNKGSNNSVIRWMGHVAHMGEMRNACKILVRKPEGRYHLEDLGVDGRIILEWIVWK
jgi:hypothetical protein